MPQVGIGQLSGGNATNAELEAGHSLESSFKEYTYDAQNRVTKVTFWTSPAKTEKLLEITKTLGPNGLLTSYTVDTYETNFFTLESTTTVTLNRAADGRLLDETRVAVPA